jgi:hypothetical protein
VPLETQAHPEILALRPRPLGKLFPAAREEMGEMVGMAVAVAAVVAEEMRDIVSGLTVTGLPVVVAVGAAPVELRADRVHFVLVRVVAVRGKQTPAVPVHLGAIPAVVLALLTMELAVMLQTRYAQVVGVALVVELYRVTAALQAVGVVVVGVVLWEMQAVQATRAVQQTQLHSTVFRLPPEDQLPLALQVRAAKLLFHGTHNE